jgi:hypothetical protein
MTPHDPVGAVGGYDGGESDLPDTAWTRSVRDWVTTRSVGTISTDIAGPEWHPITLWELPEVTTVAKAIRLTHRMDAERGNHQDRGAAHFVDHSCTGWVLIVAFGNTLTPRTTRS